MTGSVPTSAQPVVYPTRVPWVSTSDWKAYIVDVVKVVLEREGAVKDVINTLIIPEDYQYIVYNKLTIEESVTIEGKLVVI